MSDFTNPPSAGDYPSEDIPPSALVFTQPIAAKKRETSSRKWALLAIPATVAVVLAFRADKLIGLVLALVLIGLTVIVKIVPNMFIRSSNDDTVLPTDLDKKLPRSNNPNLGWIEGRKKKVDTAYVDRGKYLATTRTYTTIIPEHAISLGIFKLLRLLSICWTLLGFKPPSNPVFPRPPAKVRRAEARMRISRPIFGKAKVVSFFIIKGGVGKTTLAKLFGLTAKRERRDLSVLIQDCDNGTLLERGVRTNKLSMLDVVDNLSDIRTPADLARYCTVSPETEGAAMLAYKRPDQHQGVKYISREEMRKLIDRECELVDLVVCDLAPNEDERNRGALDKTHQVAIVVTPARDVLAKGIDTFGFLLSNGYGALARNATIVVNRRMPWTNIDKILKAFTDAYPEDADKVKITSLNYSVRFQMGLDIVLRRLSRRNETKLLELVATSTEKLADGFTNDESSQMTHAELRQKTQQETAVVVTESSSQDDPSRDNHAPTSSMSLRIASGE